MGIMSYCRANEITLSSNKKTIMPQDVFGALDDIEFGFMRPQLEAEFASMFHDALCALQVKPWPMIYVHDANLCDVRCRVQPHADHQTIHLP